MKIFNRFTGKELFDTDSADLSSADLSSADLSSADLSSANLRGADLSSANLRDADLSSANLRGADLSSAKWTKGEQDLFVAQRTIVPAGELLVWKKLEYGKLCRLRIPIEAARVGGCIGRKCRAEFAVVLEGSGISRHDNSFEYQVGKTVRAHKFDPNPLVECSGGIHFFLTKEEAQAY